MIFSTLVLLSPVLVSVVLSPCQEGVRYALDPKGERLLFLEGMREYASKVTPRQKKILGNFMDQEVQSP